MGRSYLARETTKECRRIEMSFMLKYGYIKKGCHLSGTMEWVRGGSAGFESKYLENERYLRISYILTDRRGKETSYDYKIYFDTVPSNLGKGEVLYFVCPESYKRARVLYMAYGYSKYVHRDWYEDAKGVRLFYPSQIVSNNDYPNRMYWYLKRRADTVNEELNVKHRKKHYKGKLTRDSLKLAKLQSKVAYYDTKRCEMLSKILGSF